MTISYSNPRLEAVIDNWPSGAHRTTAVFRIEARPGNVKGERGTRFTIDPITGKPGAVKTLTYATKARIVDGDDGKTYIIQTSMYSFISVMRGDMRYQEETIWPDSPRYANVIALFC